MATHFDESEKSGRKAALQTLAKILTQRTGKKLAGLKKSGAPGHGEPEAPRHEEGGLEGPGEVGEPDGDEGMVCPHCGERY